MSSFERSSDQRSPRRTASMATSVRSLAVTLTRPEKFLTRSVPPGASFSVRVTCSVSVFDAMSDGVTSARTAQPARAWFRMGCLTESRLETFDARNLVVQTEGPGVNRHSYDGVDPEGVQPIDFLLSRDTAGGGHPSGGRVLHCQDGGQAGAAHQTFGVDVGIQELVAVRLQRTDGFDGRERQRGFPAVDDDVAAAAVDRGDHPVAADPLRQRLRELMIRRAIREERG